MTAGRSWSLMDSSGKQSSLEMAPIVFPLLTAFKQACIDRWVSELASNGSLEKQHNYRCDKYTLVDFDFDYIIFLLPQA